MSMVFRKIYTRFQQDIANTGSDSYCEPHSRPDTTPRWRTTARRTSYPGRTDEMSIRHYRRAGALVLAATVGLALSACTGGNGSTDANGKTTIVIDCPPLKTDN